MHPVEAAAAGAMDQEEKAQGHSNESTDQRKEEEERESSAEPFPRGTKVKIYAEEVIVEQRKEEAVENGSSNGPDEDDTGAWSLFTHPCSLLQCVIRACASRLGLNDPFGHPKPSAAPADSPSTRKSGEEDTKTPAEVITRVRAVVPRPRPPGNPREGIGGIGGHHH